MHKPTVRLAPCVVLFLSLSISPPARAAEHPLDPLSYQEMWRVLELLRDAGQMDRDTRFSELTLQEPAKRDVLAWRPGAEMPRARPTRWCARARIRTRLPSISPPGRWRRGSG